MSLVTYARVGGLVMGALLTFSSLLSPLALADVDPVQYMRENGVRQPLSSVRSPAIERVLRDARIRARRFRVECELARMLELHLRDQAAFGELLGYEVEVLCEDAPSPAVGLYYNSRGDFLGAGSLVN